MTTRAIITHVQSLVPRSKFLPYDDYDQMGVSLIVAAGFVSLLSVFGALVFIVPKATSFQAYSRTNVWGYFASLLVSNLLSSLGTVLSQRWVELKGVTDGRLCDLQAVLKQTGNVGSAVWSLIIAIHLFNLLFLRSPCTMKGFMLTLVLGWALVIFTVLIGLIINTAKSETYFGPTGLWCWIADDHPAERIVLEYLFEFIAAFFCFLLYSLIILRVRGNIVASDGQWIIRFVEKGDTWTLVSRRDVFDTAMLRVAGQMVWYPIVYTIVLFPVACARFSEFAGHPVSLSAIVGTDIIFVLHGFLNAVLLFITRRYFPRLFPPPDEVVLTTRQVSSKERVTINSFRSSGAYSDPRGRGPSIAPLSMIRCRPNSASSFFTSSILDERDLRGRNDRDRETLYNESVGELVMQNPPRWQEPRYLLVQPSSTILGQASENIPTSSGLMQDHWVHVDLQKELPPIPRPVRLRIV